MLVKSLHLKNFRNYNDLYIEFGEKTNMVVGKNAQGKTNLVEPIYLLSTLKSFRNSKLIDCINENSITAEIEANVLYEQNFIKNVKFVIKKEGSNEFYVNNNKITENKNMLGYVYSIIFSPDELKIIKGGPEIRREFMDTDISQVSKAYVSLISRYETVLLSRNKLLKYGKNSASFSSQLDVWEEQMAVIGSQISMARQNFILKLNNYIDDIIKNLSLGKESLKIIYSGIEGNTREEKTEKFLYALKNNRERDKELGFTTVGPHRDDIKFMINDKEVKPFCSQGQQRTTVLALKIAELKTIENEKEKPILILDDVFSELDSSRQKSLIEYLQGYQIFITSTSIKRANIDGLQIFKVIAGKVNKKS